MKLSCEFIPAELVSSTPEVYAFIAKLLFPFWMSVRQEQEVDPPIDLFNRLVNKCHVFVGWKKSTQLSCTIRPCVLMPYEE